MGLLREYRETQQLLRQELPVVFYAESRHYYQYFERLLTDLTAQAAPIHYITSDSGDPLLQQPPAGVQVTYIRSLLAHFLQRVRARVVIMTMPDLNNFLYKRSPDAGCYVYLFHAAVSTHQQYRQEAFFHYDAIFCTGPYMEAEIRQTESVYRLAAKQLLPYGYPLLDTIAATYAATPPAADRPTILIAPSWFDECIFQTCIRELLAELAPLPYHIRLRFHPEYSKRRKKEYLTLLCDIRRYPAVTVDTHPSVLHSLAAADILITDRSGIALEYAFGTRRPVLFIDTPPKRTNPAWQDIGIEPIEDSLRPQIGVTVPQDQLTTLPAALTQLQAETADWANRLATLGSKLFYNSEVSYRKGVEYILEQTEGCRKE